MQGKAMTAAEAREFTWNIPARFNLGTAVCDHWAARDPARTAILEVGEDGTATAHDYATLLARSARLSHALARRGIALHRPGEAGDRVGVLLPQSLETALAHIAVMRMGGVSLPLFTLFGPEALLHRLRDSGARAVVTNATGLGLLAGIVGELPDLRLVLCKDKPADASLPGVEVVDFDAACAGESDNYPAADTGADDPAVIIYTSGTTGSPKGALHAHRVLLGHLPGVEVSHNLFPQPRDRIWTPADWAWIGGLLDVLMPGLYHGVTVVACRFRKFTAQAAFDLMRNHGIRNTFLPPTALKLMRLETPPAGLALRSVASGGEPLGAELLDWGRQVFGTTINEFYGQTECNMTVSCCIGMEEPLPGAMGRAAPGHTVAVIEGKTGAALPMGEEGDIAVRAPDPVMFLGYWRNPEATARKFVDGPGGTGRWLLTGDRGRQLPDGRFVFVGRDDDVISSAGYRIGPAEIEDCLLTHPAVHLAGVVGQPDAVRGHIVAAFVTLAEGHAPSPALAEEIARHVGRRLAAYEYPRRVHFIDDMPMTTTGKIIRADLRHRAERLAEEERQPV
ncbi:AMP-dependent synthetase [Haematobacter missouriensis]|nr:AMP-dependent synthetase [Haematobacter missouriensis]